MEDTISYLESKPTTFSEKIMKEIVNGGRKKKWFAEKLNISRPTLNKKLTDNFWTDDEINELKKIV